MASWRIVLEVYTILINLVHFVNEMKFNHQSDYEQLFGKRHVIDNYCSKLHRHQQQQQQQKLIGAGLFVSQISK
ncbi:unnamed protein product [Rotaria socialis]|uniref:Uncharacterized protein n=1 Tax=Rotaria socialis TaxID=392032 RepID=A0A819UEZ5_9BILA|nr:unnamed protein product [Rotaria socialis]